jgi:hypothetical protein
MSIPGSKSVPLRARTPSGPPTYNEPVSTPEPFGGRRYNPNTPEGQIESAGMFARGLGARRIKIIVLVIALGFGLIALLNAIL